MILKDFGKFYYPQLSFDLFLCGIVWFLAIMDEHQCTKRSVIVSITPGLKTRVDEFVCGVWQSNKALKCQHGHSPERHTPLMPWEAVVIDLIGPWMIVVDDFEIEFNALNCIDPVMNRVELVRIEKKPSTPISNWFANVWSARYSKPAKFIHDTGGKLTGHTFQLLLEQKKIQDRPTTTRNPTATVVCERMHLVIGKPPTDILQQ